MDVEVDKSMSNGRLAELSEVLLNLFDFTLRSSTSLLEESKMTPMSISTQLVSTMAVLLRMENDYLNESTFIGEQFSSKILFLNNKSIAKIPHDSSKWVAEVLSNLQRLVLRTIIVLCYVTIKNQNNLYAILKGDEINEFIEDITAIANPSHSVTDLPSVRVTDSEVDQEEEEVSGIRIAYKLLHQVFRQIEILLLRENANLKQLTSVIALLHEFNYCEGFDILWDVIMPNETKIDQLVAAQSILSQLRDLLHSVKQAKAEYVHKILCERRSHKSCSTQQQVLIHHDLLGEVEQNKIAEPSSHENLCIVAATYKSLTNRLEQSTTFYADLVPLLLLTIDRVGVCTCMSPASVVFPFLSILPLFSDVTAPLGVLGRQILQLVSAHDNENNSKMLDDSAAFVVESTEVDEHLNIVKFSKSTQIRSFTGDMGLDSIQSTFSTNQQPWLCVILYKYILIKDFNSTTILSHLSTMFPHLNDEITVAILAHVLMPILFQATDTLFTVEHQDRKRVRKNNGCSTKKNYCNIFVKEETLECCLRMTMQLLQNNPICRRIFIRHNGIKALGKLLVKEKIFLLKKLCIADKDFSLIPCIQQTAISTLIVLLSNPTVIYQDCYSMFLKYEASVTESKQSTKEKIGSFHSIFGNFPMMGSPKRSSLLVSEKSDETKHLKWVICEFNEVKTLTSSIKRVVKSLKRITFQICQNDYTILCNNSHSSFASSMSEDSETDKNKFPVTYDLSGSSDTTGYESRSHASSIDLASTSVLSKAKVDNLILPSGDLPLLQELNKIWRFYAETLQYNIELQECFAEFSGPDTALKLLNLCATSLVTLRRKTSESDFTTSLNTSVNTQCESTYSLSNNTIVNQRSRSPSFTGPQDSSNTSTPEYSLPNDGVHNDISETAIQEEIEAKLKLLSVTLNVSLICTTFNTHKHDVTVNDVISTVLPLLQQSRITSGPYCLDLCTGLFSAALQSNDKISTRNIVSMESTMSVLRKQVNEAITNKMKTGVDRLATPAKTSFNQLLRQSSGFSDFDDDSFYNGEFSSDNDEAAVSDGYHGDSESDCSVFKGNHMMLQSQVSVQGDLGVSGPRISCQNTLITPGLILHPKILLLIVKLLSDNGDSLCEYFTNSSKFESMNTIDTTPLQDRLENIEIIVKTFIALANHSSENIDLMTYHCDLLSSCFSAFSFVFQNKTERFEDLQINLFNLCFTLNKRSISTQHLQYILRYFHADHPPVDKLITYIRDLVEFQQIGPTNFLKFRQAAAQTDFVPESPTKSLMRITSVWKIAATKFNLESRIIWPTTETGVTAVMWLKVITDGDTSRMKRKSKKRNMSSSWASPKIIQVELQNDNRPSMSSTSGLIHILSLGNKQTMLQIWLKEHTLVFRLCVDPDDGKPTGILAETHCSDLLNPDEWNHLALVYSESKMPDKAIFGKVHVILNSSLERDVILEYNSPVKVVKKSDVYFMLGDNRSGNLQSSYDLGNVNIFDKVHFTTRSMISLENFGSADLTTMSLCLIPHGNKANQPSVSQSKVKYSTQNTESPLSPAKSKNTNFESDEQSSSEFNIKNLQESLVVSFQASDPNSCLVKSSASTQVAYEKKSIFTRGFLSNQSSAEQGFDPFVREYVKLNASKTNKESIQTCTERGLHRVLNKIGGINVFLMYYAKVVELTSTLKDGDVEALQCDALRTLLALRNGDVQRQKEFSQQNCSQMMYKIMSKPQCKIGFTTLSVLFNSCCANDIVIEEKIDPRKPPDFQVNFDTRAVVQDNEIFFNFILDAKLWRKLNGFNTDTSFPVWQALLHGIRALIREDHPYPWKNIKQLIRGKFVQKMLLGLQQMIADGITPFPDKNLTYLIVDIIKSIVGTPPDLTTLKYICDYLIAVHPPAGTFVCHSASNFYFHLAIESNGTSRPHADSKSHPTSPVTQDGNFHLIRTLSAPADSLLGQSARRAAMVSSSHHGNELAQCDHVMQTIDEDKVEETNEDTNKKSQKVDKPTRLFDKDSIWENLPHVTNPVKLVTSPMKPVIHEDDQHSELFDLEPRSYDNTNVSDLTIELLKLLYMFVVNMNDHDSMNFLGSSMTSANLIVMSHHDSAEVRAATIRLLSAYFTKCSDVEREQFLQCKGFHLVANQLHQHTCNRSLVEVCLFALLGYPAILSDPLPFDLDPSDPGMIRINQNDPFRNHYVIFMLALLENSSNDVHLCGDMTKRMIELFDNFGPVADVMLDNGLTLALCNLIIAVVNSAMTLSDKETIMEDVEHFVTLIALKSCMTSGSAHFNVFEDLMAMLFKVEEYLTKVNNGFFYPVLRVQALTFQVLLQALDTMPTSTTGKSPKVLRRYDSSSSFSSDTSRANYYGFMRRESLIHDMVFESENGQSRTLPESKSFVSDNGPPTTWLQTKFNRRSLSSSSSIEHSTFHSGWRARSYKGMQRRKVGEQETSRRIQRIIVIAVERIVFKRSISKIDDKDTTFKSTSDSAANPATRNLNNIIQMLANDIRDFDGKVFLTLIKWITNIIVMNNQHSRRTSIRARFSSQSSTTSSSVSPAWDQILLLSKSSLVEQTGNLLIHLLSPLQQDLQTRLLPLSLSQQPQFEKLMTMLCPLKSAHSNKISVYTYYLVTYYKQKMSAQDRKDLKQFCKILHKIGHKFLPTPHAARHGLVTTVTDDDTDDDNSDQSKIMINIEKEQESFDSERVMFNQAWKQQNNANFDKLRLLTKNLAQIVSTHAMDTTRKVVHKQNTERKKMIEYMKTMISDDLLSRQHWSYMIEQLAHERAIWFDERKYPKSWQLDNTEGPSRERRRLQRCHLKIENKFMLGKEKHDSSKCPAKPLAFIFEDDSHTSDSVTIRTRLQTNERIKKVQSCVIVTPSCETPGEILIGEKHVYFVGDELLKDPFMVQTTFSEKEVLTLSWRLESITEVNKRWWQLKDVAMEIFLDNGKTYLLAFKGMQDRDLILDELSRVELPNVVERDELEKFTQLWRSGHMTNFQYLTQLNKHAGRSFNDLMQYPVMPFVLADYSSTVINLKDAKCYRNLTKPISVQNEERAQHYRDRYKFLQDDFNNCTLEERSLKTAPFHYGSHYSNSGTVLHFLVRLLPFTRMFLEYQDNSFDIPDRTFHSMSTTYKLSSFSSTTDVKELIPEFFFMPEFLCNLEGFDFGLRQCGARVHHVNLPPWCKADPRLFVLIHRQALESDIVRSQLNAWIDLVFGFKQTGKLAVESINVFHPATYVGMDVTSVQDPVKRKALETMVKTYGQTPKQLFLSPHVVSSNDKAGGGGDTQGNNIAEGQLPNQMKNRSTTNIAQTVPQRVLSSVEGVKWGEYLGSPTCHEPFQFLIRQVTEKVGSLHALQTNDVCVLSPKMNLLVVYNHDNEVISPQVKSIQWSSLLTFGHADNIVRLKLRPNTPGINFVRAGKNDRITCCAIDKDCKIIAFGKRSGMLSTYKCLPNPSKSCDLEIISSMSLYGHDAEVTKIVACAEFRILVSASKDGTAIIWDLDSLAYVRSLMGHATAVSSLIVSTTSGDICTVCDSGNMSGSHIRLWTINGSLVAAQDSKQKVHCAAFSSAPEGVSVNVIAGGLANGVIRLWSSWDLSPIRDIDSRSNCPITSLTFTANNMTLYAATEDGHVIGWCCKDRQKDKQPLLIPFVNIKK